MSSIIPLEEIKPFVRDDVPKDDLLSISQKRGCVKIYRYT